MSMDIPADVASGDAAKSDKSPSAIDAATVDQESIALAVATLINSLPACSSVKIDGLDGDSAKIVCAGPDGEMSLDVDAQALDEAMNYIANGE